MCVWDKFLLVDIKEEKKKKKKKDSTKSFSFIYNHLKNMKLICRVTFLLCALAILLLLTPTSSLQLNPHYLSNSQDLSEQIVIKMASRKLMIISSAEHVNVMKSTVHEGSSEQLRVTSSGKSKDEEKKLSEEEEKNTLSKYLSMDYPKFRRRRPVHNKSLPLSP